ncbi:pitrilysin family protein [Ferruginibacter sp. HRS2-29]|uniref:M16 family metallopeptidase n=1 Tax=Ferruginibacter sp. HRS2-29 TaxID=2487334 RepID=UPI0020CE869E|nr:pitrilysin family protein [Ferruginibacter sp. HRS2-29]MCP9749534.1 insulinase family protein [Ferruginibacter sp. HRS2-29]
MNRKEAPVIIDAVDFKLNLKPYEYFTLDNGVPVYTIDAGAQEVVQIEWVFYAGNWNEEKRGLAGATNFMLKNGTTHRTAFQINEDFEYYGAYSNRACYNETATVTLHTLSKHLDKLLPVVNDMLTNATFPEEELEIFKQNSKQRLKVNLQKCEFVAGRLIDAYVYGEDHPYGKYTHLEDLDGLTTDLMRSFYKKYYLNGQCAIFVSGKLPSDIQQQLNEQFGKLSITKPSFKNTLIQPAPSEQKKYRIENDPKAVQGAIRLAAEFPNRHHADFKKVMVLNNIFGGFFGSRLMSNIREDKGYTYGIHSYIQNHIQQSAWLVSTEAGKDVCDATLEEIYKEMKTLREQPVDEEELSLVRNYMMGSILGDLDGPFQIMAKWKNIILNNLDEKYFYESVDAIRNTSAEELQALAQKYLQPENFYELIVY